jgi:1-acyl-sn-glycerol-3-phosphate acyltransferase
VYRFKVEGDDNIPVQGAAILACNHVSFVDAVLLMAASPRPIYFVMDHRIFRVPVLGALFRLAKAIPIAPQKDDPRVYAAAFERAAQVLRGGDLLAIFPEGGITKDGQLQEFKGGIMKIIERARQEGVEAPVIPMALTHLCLAALQTGDTVWPGKTLQRFKDAGNMTDRFNALAALVSSGHPLASPALARFHALFKDEALVIDKWFSLQVSAPDRGGNILPAVKQLMKHADFSLRNPNRARSVVSTFCANPAAFHRPDAAGYVCSGATA